jgi:hypothetical protein
VCARVRAHIHIHTFVLSCLLTCLGICRHPAGTLRGSACLVVHVYPPAVVALNMPKQHCVGLPPFTVQKTARVLHPCLTVYLFMSMQQAQAYDTLIYVVNGMCPALHSRSSDQPRSAQAAVSSAAPADAGAFPLLASICAVHGSPTTARVPL